MNTFLKTFGIILLLNSIIQCKTNKSKTTCKSQVLKTITTQADCKFEGNTLKCYDLILPGTTADITCRPGYHGEAQSITCLSNGKWSNVPSPCAPVCGSPPNISDVPWQAAIYRFKDFGYRRICGGSLITAKLVVTAAHCLSYEHKSVGTSLLSVGFGNTQTINFSEDTQFSNVSSYYIAPYYDKLYPLNSNIAVIVLFNAIKFDNFIKPICWNRRADIQNVEAKLKGTIGSLNKRLGKTNTLSAISQTKCHPDIKVWYKPFSTQDIFCLFKGKSKPKYELIYTDEGSGFAMKKKGKYYLKGVLGPLDYWNSPQVTLTNIKYHIDFIVHVEKKHRVN